MNDELPCHASRGLCQATRQRFRRQLSTHFLDKADILWLLAEADWLFTEAESASRESRHWQAKAAAACRPQTPESSQIAGARFQEHVNVAGDPYQRVDAEAAPDATVATGAGPDIDTCANVRPFVASTSR